MEISRGQRRIQQILHKVIVDLVVREQFSEQVVQIIRANDLGLPVEYGSAMVSPELSCFTHIGSRSENAWSTRFPELRHTETKELHHGSNLSIALERHRLVMTCA